MKRVTYFLGLLLAFAFLTPGTGYSQNAVISHKEKRSLEHLRKKKNQKADRSLSRQYYAQLLQKKYFVFVADYVITKQGSSVVEPGINFLSVKGDSVVVQNGRPGYYGLNSVGGVTAHGYLTGYKYNPGKKKNDMSVTSNVWLTDPIRDPYFALYVSDDGTAQLTINFGNGPVTMVGRIYSPEQAGVFVGTTIL